MDFLTLLSTADSGANIMVIITIIYMVISIIYVSLYKYIDKNKDK